MVVEKVVEHQFGMLTRRQIAFIIIIAVQVIVTGSLFYLGYIQQQNLSAASKVVATPTPSPMETLSPTPSTTFVTSENPFYALGTLLACLFALTVFKIYHKRVCVSYSS